jgi:hypothetical protein
MSESAPPPTDAPEASPAAAIPSEPTIATQPETAAPSRPITNEKTTSPLPDSLLRLNPLFPISSLPPHSALSALQPSPSTSPTLQSFATKLLTQSHLFATKTFHTDLSPNKTPKSSEGSAALVTVSKGTIAGEFWVGRRSEHSGKGISGDGTWKEFDEGLRVKHSENERDYTPGVVDAVEICRWEEEIEVSGWKDVTLAGEFSFLVDEDSVREERRLMMDSV